MTDPPYGVLRRVTPVASVLLAGNPGPMTLEGTNTWVLRAEPDRPVVVVDPGPADPAHVDRLLAAAGRVELIVLTHRHEDHSGAVGVVAERTGAPVRSVDPAFHGPGGALADSDVVTAGGLELRVWATPGHTADSVCLLVSAAGTIGAVLTGDTILGRGSSVIATPDGDLAAYLDSLRRLTGLSDVTVLPGHGPVRADCAAAAEEYLAHRVERLGQVRAALVRHDLAPAESAADAVVETVYADVDRTLWPAARASVVAQLRYLAAEDAGSRLPPGPSQVNGRVGPASPGRG
jgi:glyoxylase-like metal-dependent hydrolase (beta-lactamase superfamily II)